MLAAAIIAAVGTVLAVAYALSRDVVLFYLRRPRLDLAFAPGQPDQVVVKTEGGADSAYTRLRVTNARRRETAVDVEVRVEEVVRLDEEADPVPVGVPLIWSGTPPPGETTGDVHPGFQRPIDLLRVDPRQPGEQTPVDLTVLPRPSGDQARMWGGEYEVRLALLARNSDARRYAVRVEWDGTWPGPTEIWKHLRVGAPRALEARG